MKAIVIEDEIRNRNLINQYVHEIAPEINIVKNCENVEQSIKAIDKYNPDIVFSDIELPDGTVFDVLNETKHKIHALILITAYNQYAIKAIKYSALDYIIKPIMKEDLTLAIQKSKLVLQEKQGISSKIDVYLDNKKHETNNGIIQNPFLAVKVSDGVEMIKQETIIYCKADRNYTNIFLKNNTRKMATKPLLYFEDILDHTRFFRVHFSYLINLHEINKYIKGRGGYVLMSNGAEIEVAVRRLSEFQKIFYRV